MNNMYFLDTNIVIALAKFHKEKTIEGLMEADGLDYYKAKSIAKIYELIKQKKIKVIISPTVYDEINMGVKRFGKDVRNYLYNSNIMILTDIPKEKLDIINRLAEHYFTYTSKSGEHPFDTHPEKPNGKNDAYIMATASVIGLDIITLDKHFTTKNFSIREANRDFINSLSEEEKNQVSWHAPIILAQKPTYVLNHAHELDNLER